MNKSQHHHTSLSSANVVDNHVFNNSHINQGHHHNNQLRRKCPVHSTHSSGSSHYTSDSDDPETSSFTDDIVEEKIYVTLKSGENLGCSVVRGPQSYPGIFVQDVKRHGVAATSGLEIGDQIVGMNGFSFYPGHYNFDDAISKIKACQQMTLTVRKRVGIHFFPQFSSANKNSNNRSRVASSSPNPQSIVNKQHKIRAIVHSPPSEVTSFHLPLCPVRPVGQNSSSEATDSDYDPEKDFDFALKESSNMNGQSHQRGRSKSNNTRCKVHQSHTSNKVAEMTPDDLRRMQERLDEDRRQLQLDQIRIQEEMRRLVIERYELLNSGVKNDGGGQSVNVIGQETLPIINTNVANISEECSNNELKTIENVIKLGKNRLKSFLIFILLCKLVSLSLLIFLWLFYYI
jgi:hypothetical protein